MCHQCVIEGVKADLTRRNFFRGAAIAAASGLMLPLTQPAQAQDLAAISFSRVVDLTHTLTKDFPTYFGTAAFETEDMFSYAKDKLNLRIMKYAEHVGTHFDSPLHFSADGLSIDQLPVENFVCPLAIVDVREAASGDVDYRLTPDDLAKFEAKHGEIPEGACVAMLSGWQDHLGTDKFRGQDAAGVLHFPGFHEEATDFLMRERVVNSIAVDTISLDYGASTDSKVHYSWLPSGRYGIECVANLADLPAIGATMVAGAPKFANATGGPGRVLALL